ncbi:unnamed protein product [Discula destructiva]
MSNPAPPSNLLGSPRPISFSFADAELDRVQLKLDGTRLPSQPIVGGLQDPWQHGSELGKLRQLVDDWRRGNPHDSNGLPVGAEHQGVKNWWRSVEARLNEHQHYLVEVEGVTIHYQVYKPAPEPANTSKPVIPILFAHGWPGSFIEARPFALDLLNRTSPHRFQIIVPSLPGYGLSSQPPREHWTLADTARVFNTLMSGILGHTAYLAHGGDWGSIVARLLASYPECKLYHTNLMPPRPPLYALPVLGLRAAGLVSDGVLDRAMGLLGFDAHERMGLLRGLAYYSGGTAYAQINGTRPATLGYALLDNPVGILAYFLDKFQAWSDPRCPAFAATAAEADRASQVNDENILINAMVYHLTGTVHTSLLPYRESPDFFGDAGKIDKLTSAARAKPFGHSAFLYELAGGPRSWLAKYPVNLVFYRQHDRGGHFAALDNPAALADDVATFANEYWAAAGAP